MVISVGFILPTVLTTSIVKRQIFYFVGISWAQHLIGDHAMKFAKRVSRLQRYFTRTMAVLVVMKALAKKIEVEFACLELDLHSKDSYF